MAAVFLCADAVRLGERELEAQFRKRAFASAVIAGAIVLAGLPVVRSQAHPLFHGLVHGKGLAALETVEERMRLRPDDGQSGEHDRDRKSTRLNSSHANNSYADVCLKK